MVSKSELRCLLSDSGTTLISHYTFNKHFKPKILAALDMQPADYVNIRLFSPEQTQKIYNELENFIKR